MYLFRCPDCSREHRGHHKVVCWNDVHGPLVMEKVGELPATAGVYVVVANPGTDDERAVSDHHDMTAAYAAAKSYQKIMGCHTDVMRRQADGSLTTEL